MKSLLLFVVVVSLVMLSFAIAGRMATKDRIVYRGVFSDQTNKTILKVIELKEVTEYAPKYGLKSRRNNHIQNK